MKKIYLEFILIGSPLFFFCMTEVLNIHAPWRTLAVSLLLNLFIYFSFICLFLAVSGRVILSCYAASFFSYGVGVVNYFVRMYRAAPLTVYDFLSAKTLFTVLQGGMKLRIDWIFIVATVGYVVYWVFLAIVHRYIINKNEINKKTTARNRCMAASYVVVLYILIFGVGLFESLGVDSSVFSAAKLNGFWVNFIQSYRERKVFEPEDYNTADIEHWLKSYQPKTKADHKELPNVIVIMNESFADMSYLGDFQTDTEVLEYYRGLNENVIKGYALSSVYGGNTANSEWEFLTGNTMYFMPKGAVPYQIYINHKEQSLAGLFKEIGYKSVGFHPYPASSWNRKAVWKYLGFDETYFIEDYKYDKFDLLDGKLTDRANYEQILEYINNRKGGGAIICV